jgi:hypothetical protein
LAESLRTSPQNSGGAACGDIKHSNFEFPLTCNFFIFFSSPGRRRLLHLHADILRSALSLLKSKKAAPRAGQYKVCKLYSKPDLWISHAGEKFFNLISTLALFSFVTF